MLILFNFGHFLCVCVCVCVSHVPQLDLTGFSSPNLELAFCISVESGLSYWLPCYFRVQLNDKAS